MYIKRLEESNLEKLLSDNKVLVILGARQVGKTTLIKHLLREKVAVFFNFDIDVDVSRFFSLTSLPPIDALKSLNNPKFIVIDEAQRKPEVFGVVKGWYDSGLPVKVIVLGSSSADIAGYSAESLIGRSHKITLPTLTFREVLSVQSWYNPMLETDALLANFQRQLSEILMQSIVFGNYPEVVLSGDKGAIVNGLASDYLLKDVLQLGLVKDPEIIRKLTMLLAGQIGSLVSVSELSTTLGIARQTVERYISLLERTFVIFRLNALSTNPRKEINKSQKIYFWDTGIRNAVLGDFSLNANRADMGHLWENWVISEFAKSILIEESLSKLYFWRSRAGSEVDLVVKNGEELKAFEIKWGKGGRASRAFEEAYGVKPKLVHSSNPLFN